MRKTIDLPNIKGEIEIDNKILHSKKVEKFFSDRSIEQALNNDNFDYVYKKWPDENDTHILTRIFLLSDIDVLEYLTTIPYAAFAGCESLTSIIIPDGITEIGERAFYGCKSLTSIIIPESVTRIGHYGFTLCTSLTSITIPESVTEVGDRIFNYCNNLETIYCKAKEKPRYWNLYIYWKGDCKAEVVWGA